MARRRKWKKKRHGKILRWRTIKPRKDVYIHVGIMKVPSGFKTKAAHIRYVGKKKVVSIKEYRRRKKRWKKRRRR